MTSDAYNMGQPEDPREAPIASWQPGAQVSRIRFLED